MMSIARIVRKQCSNCGKSEHLEWGTLDELRAGRGSDEREYLDELRAFVGGGADASWCVGCGGFGVFGPDQFG